MRRIIHLTSLSLLWLIAASALFLFALQQLAPRTGLAMFGHVLTPWLLLPLLMALGYTLYAAHLKTAIGLLVALALTASHVLPLFLPRFQDAPNLVFKLKVLSFNVWINNPSTDLPAISDVIAHENPDVIALQEIDSNRLAELKVQLNQQRPGQFNYMLGDPITQQAFISRFPLSLVGIENERSRVFKVTADTPEGDMAIWSVHAYRTNLIGGRNFLAYRDLDQHRTPEEQFGWLADEVEQVSGPLIVVGDFNLPYLAAPLQDLKLKEAHQEAGWLFGFTFPASNQHVRRLSVLGSPAPLTSPLALVRLDHIFYNHHWYATRSETPGDAAGSDHAPIMAELGLQP